MESSQKQNLPLAPEMKNKFKKVSPLTSLASFPNNICVYGQNDDEYILLFIRKHKVVLVFNILLYFVVGLMPFFIQFVVNLLNWILFKSSLNTNAFFGSKYWSVILLVWLAYILRGFYNIFIKWYYDTNILTTGRFVDIDLIGIFKNRIEETSIMNIEDVKDQQSGLIDSIFNMGYIEIYTASGQTVFSLPNVPSSNKIRDFIMDVVAEERKKFEKIND